jgi:hypothetical protein
LRNFIFALLVILVVLGMAIGTSAQAKTSIDQVSLLRCAPLFGRGGIAFGETGYCEANPASWFGVGIVVGRSGIAGYEDQGASANVHDFTSGLVLVGRVPKEIKHFRFGVFLQSAYSGSHIRATYSSTYTDPTTGSPVTVQEVYRQSDRDPVLTAGLNLEYRIRNLIILTRVGKNFGDSISSNTAGGFYLAAGPMMDPVKLGRDTIRLFHH